MVQLVVKLMGLGNRLRLKNLIFGSTTPLGFGLTMTTPQPNGVSLNNSSPQQSYN